MNWKKNSYLTNFAPTVIFLVTLNVSRSLVLAQTTQLAPDGTLGTESSQITSISEQETQIDGGAIRGSNLFHSFSEFNVPENQAVNFNNPENITNIFSRVTGNNISQILGDLGVLGNANLFLINPNGIVFGENASLNVNGSFVATTANKIGFAGGNQFIANSAHEKPLLTVNVPIGLHFGNQPGAIINKAQSPQKALSNGQFNSNGNPAGLLVKPNQTLALIGSEIVLEGANLTAVGGKIELGSVGTNSMVGLDLSESGFTFDYQFVETFSDITLTNREGSLLGFIQDADGNVIDITFLTSPIPSILDSASDLTIGSINIQGRNINLLNGSQILTPTFGDINGGNLVINAEEQLTVSGSNLFSRNPLFEQFSIPSILASSTLGDGDAGNIMITTKRLVIANFGQIGSDSNLTFNTVTGEITPASGDGGNIDIVAFESITISEEGSIITDSFGTGQAGNINLKTGNLLLDDNSLISVNTEGTGKAGNIEIQTESLDIQDNSLISAATIQSDGGNINLQINNNLELRNQSNISASVGGSGDGGNINIVTEFLITSPQDNSDITATAEDGKGGNIEIDASGIFGINIQNGLTDFSDLTVSSSFGTDGTITLLNSDIQTDTTNTNTKMQLVQGSASFTPNSCYASTKNKYIQVGRGGLPLASKQSLISEYTWEDWRIIAPEGKAAIIATKTINNQDTHNNYQKTQPITPIQGWLVNQQGEIVLTANPIMVTPHPPNTQSPGC